MIYFISALGILVGLFSDPIHLSIAPGAEKIDTLKVWKIPADQISVDPLGQFYLLQEGSLVKYDSEGDSAYSWSEPQTGRITITDTGDPMRILVYQKDFNILRFLNNRLAPLSGLIRLDDLDLTFPLSVAVSRQSGFWILDGSSFRLRHIDQQLKTVVESMPLNLPAGTASSGYQMAESGDRLLLLIPDREIQVFDLFANLIQKIPVRAITFAVYGNRILLVYADKITLWKDPVTPEEVVLSSPGANIRQACLFQNKLLIRTPDQVLLLKR